MLDQPFCRNADHQIVIDIFEPCAVQSDRRCSHADTIRVLVIVVDLAVTACFAVVVLICDDKRGFRYPAETVARGLHHHDTHKPHINTPPEESPRDLLAQLLTMYNE